LASFKGQNGLAAAAANKGFCHICSFGIRWEMDLQTLVGMALSNGASDLHLEAGLPAALRIRGTLRTVGEPIPAKLMLEWAHGVVGQDLWAGFLERRSFDCSRTIQGVRCRINVLQSARGIGFACWRRFRLRSKNSIFIRTSKN